MIDWFFVAFSTCMAIWLLTKYGWMRALQRSDTIAMLCIGFLSLSNALAIPASSPLGTSLRAVEVASAIYILYLVGRQMRESAVA